MRKPELHLASASPRRREILTGLGIGFSHGGVDLDESRLDDEAVDAMVLRLARNKAMAVNSGVAADLPVLGADTIVVIGDRVFGKPGSENDELEMLAALSGQVHTVMTAVALRCGDDVQTALSASRVQFRDVSPDEARRYWHSGEPRDKAGGYAIQGLGGVFVRSVEGSYSGVVGLPVFETARLLETAGIQILTEKAQHD